MSDACDCHLHYIYPLQDQYSTYQFTVTYFAILDMILLEAFLHLL